MKASAKPEKAHAICYLHSFAFPFAMQQVVPAMQLGEYLTGRVKFFDGTQNYGFFILDLDGTDLFVHYDEFFKAGMTLEYIQVARLMGTRFAFQKITYYGKYNLSYKAVNIIILQ
eukprot:TRINITY_DN1888_c0_g2_i3.p1 TRINITY_DN1888_c0_g2~~TRINITY_DN1888_c0_g2_i3.p1  ORF type:complete len:115 (+),score=28.53 TRINITY_DN1888_c0_g2_i3:495-839(+)